MRYVRVKIEGFALDVKGFPPLVVFRSPTMRGVWEVADPQDLADSAIACAMYFLTNAGPEQYARFATFPAFVRNATEAESKKNIRRHRRARKYLNLNTPSFIWEKGQTEPRESR